MKDVPKEIEFDSIINLDNGITAFLKDGKIVLTLTNVELTKVYL